MPVMGPLHDPESLVQLVLIWANLQNGGPTVYHSMTACRQDIHWLLFLPNKIPMSVEIHRIGIFVFILSILWIFVIFQVNADTYSDFFQEALISSCSNVDFIIGPNNKEGSHTATHTHCVVEPTCQHAHRELKDRGRAR